MSWQEISGDAPAPISRILLRLGALAFLVRLTYLTEHAGSAFFNVPVLDEKYYDAVARGLAFGGSVAQINPGFRPLLYPYFLAFWYRVAGDWGMMAAMVTQHLMGVATVLMVALAASRLFGRPAAAAWAGSLYALAGPPLFFEGELLITALVTFLVGIQLLVLTRLGEDGPALGWLAAGLVTAVAAQARPNVLVFLAAFPLFALLRRRGQLRTRAALAAVALAGTLGGLLAFGLVQSGATGHFQLLGGSGGVNFYLGNKRGADGMVPRQDRPVTYGEDYLDSVQVFAEEEYRAATGNAAGPVEPGRISRYWFGRGLEEIRRDPVAWIGLLARKTSFLVWNREIPNNKNLAFVREHESTVLRVLPVQWWLLFSLAPLGAALAWRRGDRRFLLWIGLFGTLYAGSVVLFFVNSRYRVPLWPVLAVLAGGGAMALVEGFRRRDARRSGSGLAVAGIAALVSLVNWFGIPRESYARDFFFRSIARLEKGSLEGAEADARRAVQLDPTDAAAVFQLGAVALARDDDRLAFESLRRAAELRPGEPRVWNNLGIALERLERPGEAYVLYLRAIELADDFPAPYVNAALLELRAGLVDEAEAKVRKAELLGVESVPFFCARAFVERGRGRLEASRRSLDEARRRGDGEAVRRLVEENRQPLPPGVLRVRP